MAFFQGYILTLEYRTLKKEEYLLVYYCVDCQFGNIANTNVPFVPLKLAFFAKGRIKWIGLSVTVAVI